MTLLWSSFYLKTNWRAINYDPCSTAKLPHNRIVSIRPARTTDQTTFEKKNTTNVRIFRIIHGRTYIFACFGVNFKSHVENYAHNRCVYRDGKSKQTKRISRQWKQASYVRGRVRKREKEKKKKNSFERAESSNVYFYSSSFYEFEHVYFFWVCAPYVYKYQ